MNSELNCSNCCIGAFKHDLCDCDDEFCKKYKSIGGSVDFINAVMNKKQPSENDIIMLYHKVYGCTISKGRIAHEKALEYLRNTSTMKG